MHATKHVRTWSSSALVGVMLCANSSRSSKRCANDRAVAIGQELANSEENMSYHQRLRVISVFCSSVVGMVGHGLVAVRCHWCVALRKKKCQLFVYTSGNLIGKGHLSWQMTSWFAWRSPPFRNIIAFHHYICKNMAIPVVFNWPTWCIFPPNMSWMKSNAFLPGTGAICSGAAAGKSTPADQLISAFQQHTHRIQVYIGNELHNFPWHSMIYGNTGVFRKILGSTICGGQIMDPNTKMPESSATSVEPCSWTGLSFEGEVSHGELAFGATLVFRVLKEITLICNN